MAWTYFLLAYLVGSFPTGVVLTKRRYGIDVREMGSGNIGATNVTRVFGFLPGVMTLVIDLIKGMLPILSVQLLGQDLPYSIGWIGFAAVFGHCFSVFLKFKGGKGVATSLGVVIMLAPIAAAIGAIIYALVLGITKISGIGSLSGLVSVITYLVIADTPHETLLPILFICLIVLYRHRTNVARIVSGAKKPKDKG